MSTYSEFLDFARALARRAEAEIVPRFRKTATQYKADGSEVTEADREAERVIRAAIVERYPDHAILGEEFPSAGPADARYRWVLDPVDGTALFTLGVPTFGTLIALLDDGVPVVGVVHFPAFGDTMYASKGEGCWLQVQGEAPRRVHVDPVETLDVAFVSVSGMHATEVQPTPGYPTYQITSLIRYVGKFRVCGDCLQHSLVAQGRLHVAIDTIMQPWDIAAILPCIEEAGGVATAADGSRDNIIYSGSLVTSASPVLHEAVIAKLNAHRSANV